MVFDHPAVDSLRILSFIVSERVRWPGEGGMQASASWLFGGENRKCVGHKTTPRLPPDHVIEFFPFTRPLSFLSFFPSLSEFLPVTPLKYQDASMSDRSARHFTLETKSKFLRVVLQ